MKKQEKAVLSVEECESDAVQEQEFSARSFLEELEPLLKEYFYGEFRLEQNAITARFLNGQTFCIIAQ